MIESYSIDVNGISSFRFYLDKAYYPYVKRYMLDKHVDIYSLVKHS